jgi:hypothetical protein
MPVPAQMGRRPRFRFRLMTDRTSVVTTRVQDRYPYDAIVEIHKRSLRWVILKLEPDFGQPNRQIESPPSAYFRERLKKRSKNREVNDYGLVNCRG